MPTVLFIFGWRLFFYANEAGEPPHVHCSKAECDAKYWLNADIFDISPAHEYNLKPADRRMIRKIIFNNFDYIMSEWQRMEKERGNE